MNKFTTTVRRFAAHGIASAQNHGRLSVRASKISVSILALSVFALPLSASALAVAQVLGFFNIVVGLLLVASVISFGAGIVLYATRYGTWPREEAFPFMSLGITILFVVSVLLALIHFFVDHTAATLYVLAVIAFFCLAGIILFLVKAGKKKEEKRGGR
ncbi:MAG: hypothetical protein Q7S05_05045 [bacterium]|nr:hypothetical protein [bacterium]